MGAEMCISARREECHENIDINEIFKGSGCHRKIDRKKLRKKARRYKRKIKQIESALNRQQVV